MSNLGSLSFDLMQQSDIASDDSFEKDDLVPFQHDSKTINFYYSQLTKYSKTIRESYLFSDVINRLPQEIHNFQEEYHLLPENIDYFFQLSSQNYNIKEDSILTYIQCIDLLKISNFLEVRKLSSKINQYIKTHHIDVDFVIQMAEYDVKTQPAKYEQQIGISQEIEDILTSKINECLSNEKFKELPIQIIHRIIEKSSPNSINSNKLFDIIIKSVNKFCVLFPFLDLQKLSDDRLSELCEMYSKSNENTQHYFDYLKCNLNLINEMNNRKKNLEEINDEQRNKMSDLETKISSLQNQFIETGKVNGQLQSQLKNSQKLNNEQQNKMSDLETKISSLQNQFINSEKINDKLQNQLNDSHNLIIEQQNKMKEIETLLQKQFNEQLQNQIKYSKDLENQISQLQNKLTSSEKEITNIKNHLNQIFSFKGQIVATVEKGLIINAEINLEVKGSTLDTSKSKVIISTSDAQSIGCKAYEKGELITSLHMQTSFVCKPGKYYVRCIVFNTEGKSIEIVSNSVTTSASSLSFGYEGKKAAKISLPKGQYKLEVWGAKGGDSTGEGDSDRGSSAIKGGLGGYSCGILKLNKKETVYVFVGEEGRPSNSSEGSSTEGGFPDGGGTKTGHNSSYTSVPGTGGGSTSIRIGSDTNYNRVIVAGGGGGASGSSGYINPGGFGGGLSGGNCHYEGSLQNQGAGTQTGSTRGLGLGSIGDPGVFGHGATCKYRQGRDSGGGGGGGWYGGGSGGFGGFCGCSSGGGGSGWTFTETNLRRFQSGDASNASKFELNNTYFLTSAICVGGNEEFPRPDGNGKERGHNGNGFAIITPL